MADKAIPGFQKLSIAQIPDVGAVGRYTLRFLRRKDGKVVEDKEFNVASLIDNALGVRAVQSVKCAKADRCSIQFVQGVTRNAEQIELFYNSRESETSADARTFAFSEYLRQVTYSLSTTMGVARQEVGEYQHFWTLQLQDDGSITGNLLTAAYLQPQDALFFEAPSAPVVIYSNILSLKPFPPGSGRGGGRATEEQEEDEEEDEEEEAN
mmetsp:Transcript_60858/g.98549  ORF Transcript_60858/g.98549 Transcript_60858/m.98549 type:complete len:210 (-) Transcript_60858:178-807(-)